MTKWNLKMLNDILDEALRDGHAIASPEADDVGETKALQNALYNRAKGRGEHAELSFLLEGSHVRVCKRTQRGLRRGLPE